MIENDLLWMGSHLVLCAFFLLMFAGGGLNEDYVKDVQKNKSTIDYKIFVFQSGAM